MKNEGKQKQAQKREAPSGDEAQGAPPRSTPKGRAPTPSLGLVHGLFLHRTRNAAFGPAGGFEKEGALPLPALTQGAGAACPPGTVGGRTRLGGWPPAPPTEGPPGAREKSGYCNSLALQNSFPFISLLSVHGGDPPWGPEAPGALQIFASWAGLPEAGDPKASHRLAGPARQTQTGDEIQYLWQKQRAEERKTDAESSAFGHAHTRS